VCGSVFGSAVEGLRALANCQKNQVHAQLDGEGHKSPNPEHALARRSYNRNMCGSVFGSAAEGLRELGKSKKMKEKG
jgi:hypothetical protein